MSNPTWDFCTPIYDCGFDYGNADFGLYVDGMTVRFWFCGNQYGSSATSSVPLTVGAWTHIAAVRDRESATSLVYLNGTLVGTGGIGDHWDLNQQDTMWIGRSHWAAYNSNEKWLNANLDECRIWNRVLPQSEIQANMFRTLSGTETGLVTYLNFNANNFNDLTTNANNGTAYGSPSIILTNGFNTNLLILAAEVGNVMGVQFGTAASQWYSLQYNTNIITTNWIDAGLRVLGDGGPRWFFDPAGFTPLKFYRVRQE